MVPRSVHHRVSEGGQFFRKLQSNQKVTVSHDNQVPPKPATQPTRNDANAPLITDDPEDTTVSWVIVPASDSELDGDVAWILRGPAENVAKATVIIQKAIDEAKKNMVGYLVLPDPKTYRYVVGQGGAKVNSIRKATGCNITIPRNQQEGEAIEIVGPEAGVEQAKEMVLAAVKEGSSRA